MLGLTITLIVGIGAISIFMLAHYNRQLDTLDTYGDNIREDGDYIEGD